MSEDKKRNEDEGCGHCPACKLRARIMAGEKITFDMLAELQEAGDGIIATKDMLHLKEFKDAAKKNILSGGITPGRAVEIIQHMERYGQTPKLLNELTGGIDGIVIGGSEDLHSILSKLIKDNLGADISEAKNESPSSQPASGKPSFQQVYNSMPNYMKAAMGDWRPKD